MLAWIIQVVHEGNLCLHRKELGDIPKKHKKCREGGKMVRKSFVTIFVLIVAVFLMSGCASHKGAGIPGINMGKNLEFQPLERSAYEVLGPAEGKASVTLNSLFPLPIVWYSGDYSRDPLGFNENMKYGSVSSPVTGALQPQMDSPVKRPDLNVGFAGGGGDGGLVDMALTYILPDPGLKAKEAATFRAIESVPGADAIISPRFYVEKEKRFFWYQRVTVTVKAKAIRIKTDKDLK